MGSFHIPNKALPGLAFPDNHPPFMEKCLICNRLFVVTTLSQLQVETCTLLTTAALAYKRAKPT